MERIVVRRTARCLLSAALGVPEKRPAFRGVSSLCSMTVVARFVKVVGGGTAGAMRLLNTICWYFSCSSMSSTRYFSLFSRNYAFSRASDDNFSPSSCDTSYGVELVVGVVVVP